MEISVFKTLFKKTVPIIKKIYILEFFPQFIIIFFCINKMVNCGFLCFKSVQMFRDVYQFKLLWLWYWHFILYSKKYKYEDNAVTAITLCAIVVTEGQSLLNSTFFLNFFFGGQFSFILVYLISTFKKKTFVKVFLVLFEMVAFLQMFVANVCHFLCLIWLSFALITIVFCLVL